MKKRLFMMAMLLLVAGSVMAQDDEAAAETGAPVQNTTLIDLIRTGGWAMWPLGLCSLAVTTLVMQNFISLRSKTLLHSEQMPELLDLMLNKKVKTALIYCRKHPSMFANSFGAGLERCVENPESISFEKVKESVEEASIEQMARLMKPIDLLAMIGSISPMIGLLGTVSGMIQAFQTLGKTGMAKPEELAGNIGEALITTATGLIIAIPAMFFFFFFKKGFQKTLATLGRNIGYLFDSLESGKQPVSFMDLETLESLEGE